MARYRTLILAALSAAGPWAAGAAEHAAAAAGHGEGHGLPLHAVPVWPGVPVTNSMIVTWVVAAGLILFARMATRRMQAVPSGLQNFWEWLVEGLYGFLGEILGRSLVRKSFWFFASLFIFILASNYVGLLPGIGTIGYGVPKAGSALPGALETVSNPLFRGVNADLNMTFAMGMIDLHGLLVRVGAASQRRQRLFPSHLWAPGRERRVHAGGAGGGVHFCGSDRGGLHQLPAYLAGVPSLRKYLRGRKHARVRLGAHPGAGMGAGGGQRAAADSFLLPGVARGRGPGHGVHAADGGVHHAYLPARRAPRRPGQETLEPVSSAGPCASAGADTQKQATKDKL